MPFYRHDWGVCYTGDAGSILDYLVVDTYQPITLTGFEIKVTRSDWLKELRPAREIRGMAETLSLLVPGCLRCFHRQ